VEITFFKVYRGFLAEVLNNSKALKDLSLSSNRICDSDVVYLSQVLSINNNTLKILTLGKNRSADVVAEELAETLRKNQTLIKLYLGENERSNKGVQMLVEYIENDNTTVEI
jgi:Ran GTPase-activating protein (RanGAP) involved in mRNA processing and transport